MTHKEKLLLAQTQGERVIALMEFIKDWPPAQAAACLKQAAWQADYVANTDGTIEDSIAMMRVELPKAIKALEKAHTGDVAH